MSSCHCPTGVIERIMQSGQSRCAAKLGAVPPAEVCRQCHLTVYLKSSCPLWPVQKIPAWDIDVHASRQPETRQLYIRCGEEGAFCPVADRSHGWTFLFDGHKRVILECLAVVAPLPPHFINAGV